MSKRFMHPIAKLRKYLGYSQEQLVAKLSNIKRGYLAKIEAGHARVTVELSAEIVERTRCYIAPAHYTKDGVKEGQELPYIDNLYEAFGSEWENWKIQKIRARRTNSRVFYASCYDALGSMALKRDIESADQSVVIYAAPPALAAYRSNSYIESESDLITSSTVLECSEEEILHLEQIAATQQRRREIGALSRGVSETTNILMEMYAQYGECKASGEFRVLRNMLSIVRAQINADPDLSMAYELTEEIMENSLRKLFPGCKEGALDSMLSLIRYDPEEVTPIHCGLPVIQNYNEQGMDGESWVKCLSYLDELGEA